MGTNKTLALPGYQVMQLLGNGARSTIWQIREHSTGNVLALKRVVKREPSDARFLAQAANEFYVASKLDHPALRKIFHLRRLRRWMSVREVHLIMEFCDGVTLQDKRPEDIDETVGIFYEVAKALAHMNAEGFVHADMKPNNVVISPQGEVKIIDMGQSCPVGTIKERIQGTPDFIAPEQVHRRPLDGRTDVFNFGAALYWTLTGQAIPTAMPKKGAVTLVQDMTVVPPEQINPDVPTPLGKLVSDCIEVHPPSRLASMNEVVSRLGLIAHTLKRNAQKRSEATAQDPDDEPDQRDDCDPDD